MAERSIVDRLVRERAALAARLERLALPTANAEAIQAAARAIDHAARGRQFKSELRMLAAWLRRRARGGAVEGGLPRRLVGRPSELFLRRTALCELVLRSEYGLSRSLVARELPDYYGEAALKRNTKEERMLLRDLQALEEAGVVLVVGERGVGCRYARPDAEHLLGEIAEDREG